MPLLCGTVIKVHVFDMIKIIFLGYCHIGRTTKRKLNELREILWWISEMTAAALKSGL